MWMTKRGLCRSTGRCCSSTKQTAATERAVPERERPFFIFGMVVPVFVKITMLEGLIFEFYFGLYLGQRFMKLTLVFFACFTVSGWMTPLAAQTPVPTLATPAFTPTLTPTALTAAEMIDLQKIREYYTEGDYQTALSLCQNAIFENGQAYISGVRLDFPRKNGHLR